MKQVDYLFQRGNRSLSPITNEAHLYATKIPHNQTTYSEIDTSFDVINSPYRDQIFKGMPSNLHTKPYIRDIERFDNKYRIDRHSTLKEAERFRSDFRNAPHDSTRNPSNTLFLEMMRDSNSSFYNHDMQSSRSHLSPPRGLLRTVDPVYEKPYIDMDQESLLPRKEKDPFRASHNSFPPISVTSTSTNPLASLR